MSGLYIPDVRLPQDGDFELWIAVKKDGTFSYNVCGGWQNGNRVAIPVPDHGRLIDADALMDALPDDFSIPSAAAKVIEKTIIPAHKEDV